MLDKLKRLLLGEAPEKTAEIFADRDIAIAALLFEAARADGALSQAEERLIAGLIERKLGLPSDRAAALVALAAKRVSESVQLYAFTRAVNDALSAEEKIALIEMVWEVVYADGRCDEFEDQLVRRLAGLMHIPDRDRAEARQRALRDRAAAGKETP
ncbi:MAG: TerB family tellurite resistance protein [Alphaproteobacteria bacterium]|nr:TerB family tellurite resistance protein [Alphaproteobacteria bacterium]